MPPATDNGRPATDFVSRHPLTFTCLLCIAWMLPGLLGRDPWKPDEAYSFGLVYHILQSGDWVIPTLAQEPFMEKPPLFYLTAALFARLFGWLLPLHDAARLATAFYLSVAFVFIGLTGKELYDPKNGNGASGWISVLALLGCVGLLERGHFMITDISLLSGVVIALYGLALAPRRGALGGIWLGTGVGVGFMSKGLLSPGVLGITCLLLPAIFPQWRTRRYLATLAVAFVAALPWLTIWPIAVYLRSPELFHEWLWVNNFGRYLGLNTLGPSGKPGYYLGILPWFAFPVWLVAVWALWVRRREIRSNAGLHLPLTLFLVVFFVLSISHDARELYALPTLPSLALLAVPGLPLLRRGAANALWWFALMVFCFFALAGWFYWIALDLNFPLRLHTHLMRLRPAYEPSWQLVKFLFGLGFTAAWIWLIPRLPRSPLRPLIAWSASVALLWGVAAVFFVPWIDSANTYRGMVLSIRDALPAKYRCVSSYNLGEPQRAMLEYFVGIVTRRENEPARQRDCDVLLVQGSRSGIYVPDENWEAIWFGARPGDDKELYRLYRRKPVKRS
jgi:4-amino-4-deoxy-L-arabinose transferase-like glycosyltransferase